MNLNCKWSKLNEKRWSDLFIFFCWKKQSRLFVNSKHKKTGEEESNNRSVCFPLTVVVAIYLREVRKTGCWQMEGKRKKSYLWTRPSCRHVVKNKVQIELSCYHILQRSQVLKNSQRCSPIVFNCSHLSHCSDPLPLFRCKSGRRLSKTITPRKTNRIELHNCSPRAVRMKVSIVVIDASSEHIVPRPSYLNRLAIDWGRSVANLCVDLFLKCCL